ncbi:MAG: (5-formylfuran-3-yl)methyl phosphate synthase [Bacteroidetes bacterium]|nr:(5-formylfuran-3-yl)methyl phosphate synthase [Bacteroidota bacterium]MBU2585593.1 (5-formylfuran-3-yl)methyl phosphate synthase [Bacteroidota bacterium]
MGRLLVSVRGSIEALEAVKGGAHIADVEFPASALGTPYPLNIKAVRDKLDKNGFKKIPISTNIGEKQNVRSNSCQAALGVALAGADYVKLGFAGLDYDEAVSLGNSLVRTVKHWFPKRKVYPAVFPENKYSKLFDPLREGPKLVKEINCDGLLIDTFKKDIGKGLLDYYTIKELKKFVNDLHKVGKEAWLAGSITKEQLLALWGTGVDVICVRGAACERLKGEGRFGKVKKEIVEQLTKTK